MSQEITKTESPNYAQILEKVITGGDLSLLTPEQRTSYYLKVCESINLNPLTKPFAYIELKDRQSGNKRIVLYALKDCCEQLRKRDKISIEILERIYQPDIEVYMVRTRATDPFGRYDEAIGAVSLKGMVEGSFQRSKRVCSPQRWQRRQRLRKAINAFRSSPATC